MVLAPNGRDEYICTEKTIRDRTKFQTGLGALLAMGCHDGARVDVLSISTLKLFCRWRSLSLPPPPSPRHDGTCKETEEFRIREGTSCRGVVSNSGVRRLPCWTTARCGLVGPADAANLYLRTGRRRGGGVSLTPPGPPVTPPQNLSDKLNCHLGQEQDLDSGRPGLVR